MKKATIILMLLTIVSKVSGFMRDIILSYFYGASNVSDAYLISLTIPTVIFSFIGVGISTGYIPMYSKIETRYGEDESNKYTNNLINILLIFCTIMIVFGLSFTRQIVTIFASGFKGETLNLAIRFTRIGLIGIYFTSLIYVANAFLQLKESYAMPVLIVIISNFIIILSILLSFKTNIIVLSIGSVIASASQLFALIPFIHRKGYRYKFILNIKDKFIKSMAISVLPVILGTSVNQINTLVDRSLASSLVTGGISALNYANKLNSFIQGIFVMSISTVLYPTISKMAADRNMNGLKKSVSEAVNGVNLLVMPVTMGAMILSEPIVRMLFGRGSFDSKAIILTKSALFFYSIGMVGFGLREVLSRVFYSMQDTKTPMMNASIGVGLNIILNLMLSKYLGIGGLALATSISAMFTTILLFISLRKKIGPFGMKQISISFLKILFASLVMGLIAKLSFNYLTADIFSQNLSLIISIGIGALTYFVVIYFMKIDDVDVIVNAVKKKLTKSKTVT